jgi:Predicted integral membrane protein (DUF2275)
MNCEEVQKGLSDFLDKSLDVERAQEVSDHFAACSVCSEEMASVAECQRLVSGLPIVEPPVGFTNRVMAEVREAARKPSLWERLFLPLRINIPLQATAVVLIAALAAYIYQREPLHRESLITVRPEKSPGRQDETDKLTPPVAQAPAAESKRTGVADVAKSPVQEFKDSAQWREPQSAPTKLLENQVRSPATLDPTPLQEKSSATSEAASPRLEQSFPSEGAQAKASPARPLQPEKDNVSKDAAPAGESLSSAELRERRPASSLDALRSGAVVGVGLPADHELAIRLKEPGQVDKATVNRLASDRARSERLSSMPEEESKNLDQARQRTIQTGQVQTIWVTIARNQYDLFKKELAELGNIEMESSTPDLKNDSVSKSSDRLRIKVTILPPLSSGLPAPSQPSGR